MNRTIRVRPRRPMLPSAVGVAAVTALVALLPLAAVAQQDDHLAAMEREHAGDEPVASPAVVAPEAAVEAAEIVYGEVDGVAVSGYLARPLADGASPGLIVIHEWWGLNDNIRAMARRLAGEGYAALAVDLYGGEFAADRETASRLAGAARDAPQRARANLAAAHAYLADELAAPAIGTIGWCFGGGWSLDTGISLGDAVDAVVIYYGRLVTEPDALRPLSAPVLGIFGSEDRGIPVATVREFESALAAAGKEASIHVYDGADHAFANPSGTRFQAEAAEDAWARTLEFFSTHLSVD